MGDLDTVHPIDRELHAILAHIAETTSDPHVRRSALDLQLTLPPICDWTADQIDALHTQFTEMIAFRR